MKNVIILLFMLVGYNLDAQVLVMSDETSDVKMVTRHLAGRLDGQFKGVQGTAHFNPANLAASNFRLKFNAGSVTISDTHLGPNLIDKECFNPDKFPYVELNSSSITRLAGEHKYQFNGQLKVKGKSRKISFPMTATANAGGYDFTFDFAIPKKAFDLQCGAIGKEFKISIRTYGKQS